MTRELNPGGCAYHYMNSVFSNLAGYVKSLDLPRGSLLIEAPQGWEAFTGTAFDRRLRYEYQRNYSDQVVTVGAERLEHHSGIRLKGRLRSRDLDERCIYAAVADWEFRAGEGAETWNKLEAGGTELKERLIEDIRALLAIAKENLPLSKPQFGSTFWASPWIGGADADLIDEGCLIDIKCGKKIEATKFLRQAIAYAMLDVEDDYRLDSVGIYLARQGILWKIALEDVARYYGSTISEMRDRAPWSTF